MSVSKTRSSPCSTRLMERPQAGGRQRVVPSRKARLDCLVGREWPKRMALAVVLVEYLLSLAPVFAGVRGRSAAVSDEAKGIEDVFVAVAVAAGWPDLAARGCLDHCALAGAGDPGGSENVPPRREVPREGSRRLRPATRPSADIAALGPRTDASDARQGVVGVLCRVVTNGSHALLRCEATANLDDQDVTVGDGRQTCTAEDLVPAALKPA